MKIEEIKMDLFQTDKKYSLVHCISQDCAMAAGIAKIFVQRFPNMKPELIKIIEKNNLKFPKTIMYEENDRVIFNLVTKEKYWHKPTYATITECIEDLAFQCKKDGVKYLAMPLIGCGLDRLQWSKVREIIENNFTSSSIEILICRI